MIAQTVVKLHKFITVHLFFPLQNTDVVVHNKGLHMKAESVPPCDNILPSTWATANVDQVTCAMHLGSVQSSPAIGWAAICPAYAGHIVYQTRHSPPASTSSRRTPWHTHNCAHYNMDTIFVTPNHRLGKTTFSLNHGKVGANFTYFSCRGQSDSSSGQTCASVYYGSLVKAEDMAFFCIHWEQNTWGHTFRCSKRREQTQCTYSTLD